MAPKVVIVAGPPCAGKGTQCRRIAQERGLIHISTGDVFRSEVAKGSELGLMCKPFLESGSFVPDELVINCEHHPPLDGWSRFLRELRYYSFSVSLILPLVPQISSVA
jgi:hypothetical protein